jgi:MoxR-like ATPase
VLGVSVYNPRTHDFETRRGPIFTNVVLADEINRAPPRTQSGLLEAMQEGRVTIDERTHELPRPFLVMATQNPLEQHGTYPAAGEPARPVHDAAEHRLSGRTIRSARC